MSVERQLRSLVDSVSNTLPEQNILDATELLDHGEWGEALSLVCTQLYEYDVGITLDCYQLIEGLGQQMKMPPREWEMLRGLIVT